VSVVIIVSLSVFFAKCLLLFWVILDDYLFLCLSLLLGCGWNRGWGCGSGCFLLVTRHAVNL